MDYVKSTAQAGSPPHCSLTAASSNIRGPGAGTAGRTHTMYRTHNVQNAQKEHSKEREGGGASDSRGPAPASMVSRRSRLFHDLFPTAEKGWKPRSFFCPVYLTRPKRSGAKGAEEGPSPAREEEAPGRQS